ncbi:hypothetical protein F5X68DRAFT_232837 [Plectosphaerella plurivora]|uniref:DUF7587 domain-containing protein n=1 Tax=Plectosphaerella plurivora TaxID=936078 RepID=A0A9P9A9I2_9PEZI|nr:hypothetical protein F5X68DRAFT_232837 [Plectosphaerella plurivora]
MSANGESSVTGIFSASTFIFGRREDGVWKETVITEPAMLPGVNVVASALEEGETAVICCKSDYTVDPLYGCYSNPPATSYTDFAVCQQLPLLALSRDLVNTIFTYNGKVFTKTAFEHVDMDYIPIFCVNIEATASMLNTTNADTKMPSSEDLQLYTNRPLPGIPSQFAEDDEDPTFPQRLEEAKESNDEMTKLNEMSRKVELEIYANLWAVMYWDYLIDRLFSYAPVFIDFTRAKNGETISCKPKLLPTRKDKFDVDRVFLGNESSGLQLKVLERRYLDACQSTQKTWDALAKVIGKIVESMNGDPADDEIAFRAFHDGHQAKFFTDHGDIRCGNWRNFDINRPCVKQEADDHVRGYCYRQTDYISITTSPRRLWNFITRTPWKFSEDIRIAVIDLRVLTRLGIAFGSTKGNGRDELGLNSTKYATKHHLLVAGWIPSQAIKGLLSIGQLRGLMANNDNEGSKPELSSTQVKVD